MEKRARRRSYSVARYKNNSAYIKPKKAVALTPLPFLLGRGCKPFFWGKMKFRSFAFGKDTRPENDKTCLGLDFIDRLYKLGIIFTMKRRVKQAHSRGWHTHLTWLKPGLGIKRWLIFLALGVGMLSLGGAFAFRALYPLPRYFYYLTLQFLPRILRATIFLVIGIGLISFGLWGFNRTILKPFISSSSRPLPSVLYDYRRRGRGPKITIIGGGHGQATVLRGLKAYTSNLTAIVTVADDGGSSGRLRRQMGILPPGDFRNCIAALADNESLVARLFQYRFASGKDLEGHSFGNLFISAMADITGSFESALRESSRVLAVQGQVLPSTLETVTLCADIQGDMGAPVRVCGESRIPEEKGRILRVTLEPESPKAYPGTLRALLDADIIIIGPGSLYTSVLPNLLVPEIVEALQSSPAPKVYICNIVTQPGETDDYSARAHLAAVEQHIGKNIISTVVLTGADVNGGSGIGTEWVMPDLEPGDNLNVVKLNGVDPDRDWRHKSDDLAQVIMNLIKDMD